MIVKELFARLGLDMDGASFEAAEAAIGGLKISLAAVGAAVGGMAVGLAASIKATADAGDAAKKMAAQAGVSVEAIQALGYAADFSGSSMEEVGHALNFLAKNGSKDVEGDFRKIADQIASMEDGGAKSALAIEKFGRSGAALIPLLNEGSEGLARFREEAEALGVIMSAETTANAEAMNDAIDRVNASFIGLRNQAVAPLIPWVTQLADRFTEWVKQNRELIRSRLDKAIKFVIAAARMLWRVLRGIATVLEWAIDNWKLLAAVLMSVALVAIIANYEALLLLAMQYFVVGNAAVATAIKAAIAWAAAALPWVALGAAILLVILILEDLYQWITGGDSLIDELGQNWSNFLDEWFASPSEWWVINFLKAVIRVLTDVTKEVPEALAWWGEAFSEFFSWLGGLFVRLGKWVAGLFTGFWSDTKFAFTELGTILQDFWAGVFEWIGKKATAFVDTITAPIKWVWDKMKALGRATGEALGLAEEAEKKAAGAGVDASAGAPAPSNPPGFGVLSDAAPALAGGSVPMMFGGGAASPMASATGNANAIKAPIVNAPKFDASISVTAAPGEDPGVTAGKVRDQLEEFHASKMREAYAAIP